MHQNRIFTCFCNQQIQLRLELLKEHIKRCPRYRSESPFQKEFQRLPLDNLLEVHLLAIKAEFQNYIDELDVKLNQRGGEVQRHQPPQGTSIIGGMTVRCLKCQRPLDTNLDYHNICKFQNCDHIVCKACLMPQILSEYVQNEGQIKCVCGKKLDDREIEIIVGRQKKEQLDTQVIEKQYNLVTCVKCSEKFAFEKGNIQGINLKDQNGNALKSEYINHYVENRFNCLSNGCRTEQCKECKATPYHLGLNCREFTNKKLQKKCRFCDQIVLQNQTVCRSQDCQEKLKDACTKTLPCGHNCCGYRGEINCLPCLHDDCSSKLTIGQKGDEYCNICFIESLNQAPCIRTSCGHIFHYHCIKKRLDSKWNGPRITFNFCACTLCKQWQNFPEGCEPQTKMVKYVALFEAVKKKAVERLKHEGMDKDPKLISPNSHYFEKPIEFAMNTFTYIQCFKCNNPYFAGRRDCMGGIDDDIKDFKPEQYICGDCCEVRQGDTCNTHGKEFIEYKCKFCCSVAQWFCWGTTHFCDSCHRRQCNGDYVSKYARDKLPKCTSKETCPLKIDHKPNGDEFALGCTICRNIKANVQQF